MDEPTCEGSPRLVLKGLQPGVGGGLLGHITYAVPRLRSGCCGDETWAEDAVGHGGSARAVGACLCVLEFPCYSG